MADIIKTAKKLVAGAAVAGVAGYLAGLLTAPKSGQETRDQLRTAAGKNVSEVELQLKELQTELSDMISEAKDRSDDMTGRAQKELHKLLDGAKDSKDKARTVLGAVHDGKASDKDLQKAITDAKHTLQHVKDYLKK